MRLTQKGDNAVIPPWRGSKKLKEYQDNGGRRQRMREIRSGDFCPEGCLEGGHLDVKEH